MPTGSPSCTRAASRWLAENGLLADAVRHAIAGGDDEHAADLVELGAGRPAPATRRTAPCATGWARCPTTSSAAGRCSPPSWRGAGSPRATSTGWRRGSTPPRPASTTTPGRRPVRHGGLAGRGGQGPGGRGPLAPGHDRGLPRLGRPGPRRRRRHGRARPPGARAGRAGRPLRARWRRRVPRPGGLGRRRPRRPRWTRSPRRSPACTRPATSRTSSGATVVLASMWLARGRPDEARRLYERALATAESRPRARCSPRTGDLHVGLADVLREQGDLDAAAEHLEAAARARRAGVAAGEPAPLVHRDGRHCCGRAATSTARSRMLDQAEPLFLPGYFPDVRPIPATGRGCASPRAGSTTRAAWAREHRVAPTDPRTYLAEYDQLTLARLLVAGGVDRARRRRSAVLDRVLDGGRGRRPRRQRGRGAAGAGPRPPRARRP